MAKQILNLLVIDEEQLYAERLVSLLEHYYDEVNLGFFDEKAELIKALRQEWDVLVFHRAYDLGFTDVVGVLQEHQYPLPLIRLSADVGVAGAYLPEAVDGDMIQSLRVGDDALIVMSICLQAAYQKSQRQNHTLQRILKEAEQRTDTLIKNSKSAVAYIDQGVHVFANDPYLELFGYDSMDDIIGVPVVDLIASGDDIKGVKQFLRRFDKGDRSQVELDFESRRTDGSTFASKLQVAAATLEGAPVTQIIIQRNEVSNEALAKKLAEAERQDPLTGLANRIAFQEALAKLHSSALSGNKNALLYARMDDIGKINSSAGIQGVDTSIKYVANLLSEHFGDGFVSRFSDTSFAILLDNISPQDALAEAEAIRAKCESLLIEVGKRTITTTLSVAVVAMDSHAPDAETVLNRAIETVMDIAAETDNQGNAVRLFDIRQHASDDEDALAEYIKSALTDSRFILRYQPVYDIETDASDLSEVYITLPMADGSELTLDKFSGIAKKYQLMDKVDRWMLINACKHLAQVRQSHPKANLLINLSSTSLADAQLPQIVSQLVKAVGDGRSYPLTLQFAEPDLVDYLAAAKRQFMALANINCPVSVHNFGITAKSAEILTHLSPNMARLARAYTKDLDRPNNLESAQSLVTKANSAHVNVLMPYIEDAQTMSMAWSIGARYLQGNYLQAPSESLTFAEQTEQAGAAG